MSRCTIGVLAFHGDVIEHIRATQHAALNVKKSIHVIPVRTNHELRVCNGLIIPGGESTTLSTLCIREGMLEDMKKIPALFGTCAGAILLAKNIQHKAVGQKSLELIDITVVRNAYGRQTESFEKTITTTLGNCSAIFIRAPKISRIGPTVSVLAHDNKEIVACEERTTRQFLMACTFHPELSSTLFHSYFITQTLILRDKCLAKLQLTQAFNTKV